MFVLNSFHFCDLFGIFGIHKINNSRGKTIYSCQLIKKQTWKIHHSIHIKIPIAVKKEFLELDKHFYEKPTLNIILISEMQYDFLWEWNKGGSIPIPISALDWQSLFLRHHSIYWMIGLARFSTWLSHVKK